MQNRFKSKVLWSGIASLVVSFLIQIGVIDTGMGDTINQAVSGILNLLAAFAVFNDPTNPNGV
ncbi:MAG TPA: phage holin [Candidatus Limiplasma sp.]|nr:phage holin [Candidatus Limiplasma sp.]